MEIINNFAWGESDSEIAIVVESWEIYTEHPTVKGTIVLVGGSELYLELKCNGKRSRIGDFSKKQASEMLKKQVYIGSVVDGEFNCAIVQITN